ncbi:LemA family protein [Lentilactobacillus laojiaonis]|uniref:LemA family protein n=1 Tax=Lentilactobacillus laojiaonis TaxID=2883998 RepID=UPI001D0A1B57|nr:LemA family protein [Lentilactobacillus laojiaonis]UDM32147.1 LemA family protein [Lentilactobacillus laojiaonis]
MIITIIILVVLVVIGILIYNGMVSARNTVDEAQSQIGVQLKRRADLIPNLVNTVKGYAKHEHDTFMDTVEARNAGHNNGATLADLQAAAEVMGNDQANLAQRVQANDAANAGLGQIFAVAENYPNLQASTNFGQLQEELTTTENRVAASRTNFNRVVRDYNTRIQSFPANLLAGMFHFTKREQLPTDPANETVPEVKF